jgi:hypothetical protein
MKTNLNKFAAAWIRSGVIALSLAVPCASLAAGCSQAEGSRCNPDLSHDECDNSPTVQCVQPAASACNAEAYCCAVDANGNITSMEPNCQYLIMCQAESLEAGVPEASTPEASTTPEASVSPEATPDAGDGQ